MKKVIFSMVMFFLIYGFLDGGITNVQTASASTGDPNSINYKDAVFQPASYFYEYEPGFSTNVSVNQHKFTNIQYNKTTRKLTFEMDPQMALYQSSIIPSYQNNPQRAADVVMCVAVITESTKDNYTSGLPGYTCDRNVSWNTRTAFTALRAYWVYTTYAKDINKTWNLTLQGAQILTNDAHYAKDDYPVGIYVEYNVWGGHAWFYEDGSIGIWGKAMGAIVSSGFIPLARNEPPTLTINSPNNQTLQNEPGRNTTNIEGYAHDPDNDDLTISAEIPNVFYRKTVVSQTQGYKPYSIPIDAIADSIPPGDYTITVKVSDPAGMSESKTMTVKVRNRLKRNAYVLVNSPIENSGTTYEDYEGDPKYAERVKYQHDPDYFDNSMGLLSDSGLWRTGLYTSFPYSGEYIVTYQAKDIPKYDSRFAEYQIWSRDAASSMSFQVHRKPVALFTARLAGNTVQLADSSYDLDHAASAEKGIMQWQWQYKKSYEEMWTDGQPGAVSVKDNYDIRLRVRDVDGDNGIGVWSDWCQRTVGTASGNLPPVALFTVNPGVVSYRKATAIIDKSFDPDNDPLDIYSWSVVKDGWNTVWSHWGGATTPPNIAQFGTGNYQLNLQVHDNRGLWSPVYSQTVQVVNHPPAAAFSMPNEVYRDTVITLDNQTPDPDADGDSLTYSWNARKNGGAYYWAGNNRFQSMTIRDLISRNGITPKQAISDGWEMLLTASDGSLSSNATKSFIVKNHIPAAAINGSSAAKQFDTRIFTSSDVDEDSSDQSSLAYYWKVTHSDGSVQSYRTQNVQLTFNESGVYTLEHWAIDQVGDKSNIAVLLVNVSKNLAPSMLLTSPAGTLNNPTVLDAELQGDPLVKWTYSDPENDLQEKVHLDFFSQDDVLAYSVENTDNTGLLRQYQMPDQTFERFKLFYLYGRAYSKQSWSDASNEKAFIIDNPPQPGFTLITDTGRNAALGPVYRTDVLHIQSTATDQDIPEGDIISYKYYLKPASGAEGLASGQASFTKQLTANGTYTLRQVVTDSLGLSRELSQNINVVNRIPAATITYPASTSPSSPTIVNTLTPVIKWDYQDADGDVQQRFKVRIMNAASGAVKAQSGEQVSGAKQWQVPAGTLAENEKYAVEVEVYDGFSWSSVSPRKYMMVNLLSIKGAVRHTEEWNNNRQAYNLKQSGDTESPRGYNVYWAGEKFILQAAATGLPDTVQVTMTGGYSTQLSPTGSDKTVWTGELADPAFEQLPDGLVTFTFTAANALNSKTDTVMAAILGDWSEYYQSHRVK